MICTTAPSPRADTWLSVAAILSSAAYTTRRSLLLITWDENDDSPSNQVATQVIAEEVLSGFQSQVS